MKRLSINAISMKMTRYRNIKISIFQDQMGSDLQKKTFFNRFLASSET